MTDTIHAETSKNVLQYLSDNWDAGTTPILWKNREQPATSGYTQFIKAVIQFIESGQRTITGPDTPRNGIRRDYFLTVFIYERMNKGDSVIRQVADLLEVVFTNQKITFTSGDNHAIFEVPSSPLQIDSDQDGWYREKMNFPFYVRN